MMMPKRIERRKLTGQLGINLIERIVLRMGYAWHPSNSELDAGIDGIIEICNPSTGEATNCIIQVQSRALGSFTAETETSFEYVCDQRDLTYWLTGNVPVILIVSRRNSDEAYWVAVKDYFHTQDRRKERRIYFQKRSDQFSEECANALCKLAVPRKLGLYFAPRPYEETLWSNLLRVTRFPEMVYSAETKFRLPRQVWSHVRTNGLSVSGEWILHDKRILSVHDLRTEPWTSLCHSATLDAKRIEEYSLAEARDIQNLFVRLLHQCLKEKLSPLFVAFHQDRELFYFKATPKLTPRRLSYPSLKELTARVVFGPYKSKTTADRIAYYRHSAFEPAFFRFEDVWYLQVTPTYLFTSNGYKESRFAAERMSGIKRLERNGAVLGQLLMWTECLTAAPTLYDAEYPHLAFQRPEVFTVPVGIDESEWMSTEDEDTRAIIEDDMPPEGLFD